MVCDNTYDFQLVIVIYWRKQERTNCKKKGEHGEMKNGRFRIIAWMVFVLLCCIFTGCGRKGKAPYEAAVNKVFICGNYDEGDIVVINMDVTNNTKKNLTGYAPVSQLTAALDGETLERTYVSSDNPDAIANQQKILPGASGQAQAGFVLPEGVTEGTLSLVCVVDSINKKSKITLFEEEIDLGTVEKIVSEEIYGITIDQKKLTDDGNGNPLLVLDYTFTNNSDETTRFSMAIGVKVFQDGVSLNNAYLPYRHPLKDTKLSVAVYTDIMPGKSIAIREVYALNDVDSDVELSYVDRFSFDNKKIWEETIELSDVETVVAESAYEFKMDGIYIGYADYVDGYVVVMEGEFTNNSEEVISFQSALDRQARQSGMEMQYAYVPGASFYNINSISPGTTIGVAMAWELNSAENDVSITVIDRNSYNNMIIFDQTYTIEELLRNALSDADMAEFADEMVDKSMKKLTGDFKKVL